MHRVTPFVLAFAALCAACDRPEPLLRRLVVSADFVSMDVTEDVAPTYRLWAMGTEPEDQKTANQMTATVVWGSDWLSAEIDVGREPYGFLLRADPHAFQAPGNYAGTVTIQAPGTETRWVSVNASVGTPSLEASTNHIRFQMAAGGAAPAPRTVLVTAPDRAPGIAMPEPHVSFFDDTCGGDATAWVDAAVTTSGTGWALTLEPVAAALSPLPSGTECRVSVWLTFTFDPYPGGGSPWQSSAQVTATLGVQPPDAQLSEIAQASWTSLSFAVLEGSWNAPTQAVRVTDALGGQLTRPSVEVSAPWLGASLSATRPYVLTVYPRAVGLPAGEYRGTVWISNPASPLSDRVDVTLRVEAWARSGWTMPALGPSVTEVADGRVLVAGGRGSGNSDPGVQRCELLPCSGAVFGIGRMVTPRFRHTATEFAPGHLVAAGGLDPATGKPVATWEIYDDPHSHMWYVERLLAVPRFLHTATLLPDGRVLVAGGAVGDESSPIAIADAELLDPGVEVSSPVPAWNAHGWPIAAMTVPRRGASAVLLPSGNVLVAGGQRVAGEALASAELFDPSSGTWSLTAPMNEPRADAALVVLENGRVLAAGGTDGQRALATAELYDPATETWTYTTSMALGRVAPAVRLPSGSVLLVGGLTGSVDARVVTGAVERFDPLTESWTSLAALNEPRTAHAVTVFASGLVVVAGGTRALPWDDSTLVADVESGFGVAP